MRMPQALLGSTTSRQLIALLVALLSLVASCKGESPLGQGGVGGEHDSAAIPAALRMSALRMAQQAPGHDFEARPGGALSAPIGESGTAARVEVSAEGRVEVTPARGGARFALRTVRAGRRGAGALAAVSSTRADGQEAVLARGSIEERYLAGPRGLEQSFQVSAPPPGKGPLEIDVAFDGVAPEAVPGSRDRVRLRDDGGTVRGGYRDLLAADADGRALPARMEVSAGRVSLVIEDAGAAYPVAVDPLVTTLEAELFLSDGAVGDAFGGAVSISVDTAIIGASGAGTYQGAAYVMVRTGTSWAPQAKLVASDGAANDSFGCAVSVSGDTAVVTACGKANGAVYVFVRGHDVDAAGQGHRRPRRPVLRERRERLGRHAARRRTEQHGRGLRVRAHGHDVEPAGEPRRRREHPHRLFRRRRGHLGRHRPRERAFSQPLRGSGRRVRAHGHDVEPAGRDPRLGPQSERPVRHVREPLDEHGGHR
jgi:hypothetical protein